jgi:hypothetical protein
LNSSNSGDYPLPARQRHEKKQRIHPKEDIKTMTSESKEKKCKYQAISKHEEEIWGCL